MTYNMIMADTVHSDPSGYAEELGILIHTPERAVTVNPKWPD